MRTWNESCPICDGLMFCWVDQEYHASSPRNTRLPYDVKHWHCGFCYGLEIKRVSGATGMLIPRWIWIIADRDTGSSRSYTMARLKELKQGGLLPGVLKHYRKMHLLGAWESLIRDQGVICAQ